MHRYIKILRRNIYFFIFIVIIIFFVKSSFTLKKKKKSNEINTKIKKDFKNDGKQKLKRNSINLNKANFKVLKKINGIGPSKAAKIIEYRQNHGRIYNMKELLNIDGIGKKLFKKIDKYSYVKFK